MKMLCINYANSNDFHLFLNFCVLLWKQTFFFAYEAKFVAITMMCKKVVRTQG